MTSIAEIAAFLEQFAPSRLAESWDNVGLLVGDDALPAERVMTCLTVTPATVREAVADGAQLIVTHHPLPFRALKRLTRATPEGAMLLDLMRAGIAVFSPHTAFDSAAEGINQRLADGLGLQHVQVLVPSADGQLGAGRWGSLPSALSLEALAAKVKTFLNVDQVQIVGARPTQLHKVSVACGSAGEFLGPAVEAGCDCLVTGEVRFHTALEAEARGIALVLAGHYASERFAVEALAEVLAGQFPGLHIWASRQERDPVEWI